MEICRKRSSVKGPRNCRHRARRQKASVLMPNSFSCRNRRNKNPLFKMKQYERFAQRTLRSLSLLASSLFMNRRQTKYPKRLHMRTRKVPVMMRTSAIFSLRYVKRSAKNVSTSIICSAGTDAREQRYDNATHSSSTETDREGRSPCRSLSTNTKKNPYKRREKLF